VYALKSVNGKNAKAVACKLLLNSTYGRIGLRPEREIVRVSDRVCGGRELVWCELPNGMVLNFCKIFTKPKSNYPFAAYITDNARGRLYAAFVKMQALYGDTDSVFSRKRFGLQIGGDLGEWKHEGNEYFQAQGVKDYRFGDKEILKGGKHFYQWTLKTLAQGRNVREIQRTRKTPLEKRVLHLDGSTSPLIVGKER
jgi:hypothetical protein